MAPVIETDGLTRLYGPQRGIENLNLEIQKGEIYGYLGPNGAGKTTTIRLMMGYIRARRGVLKLFGEKAGAGSVALRRRIGYLPSELGFHDDFTGERALHFYEKLSGVPAVHRDWLCTQLRFTPAERRRRIGVYSKGMKQKLGIIQALQHDPELLILDEPTSGLDPLVQEAFYDILHELRDRGRTVFFSSHVLAEVQRLCDRVGVVKDARLVLNTTMSEMANSADRLLWVKLKDEAGSGSVVEAGNVPAIAKARFIRATGGGWLLYLAAPQDSARIVNELARIQPIDFRFEPAVEEAFLKLYGITLRNRGGESRQP